ncbi:hypothetical protein ASG25_07125 [Rhizobium sp. Leaf384]|uniref:hypothetical protein n=1 Tax=unclassified Rhizobium TaxID=2613769 RepID=UPI000712FBB7|nr:MULTISPECIES: hypothetical protein [unclassified Rhizobium]KQS81247.1 hypothetical protein ASG25_07125 [Rhizobium sp. Leaf384]KQS87155.1 hypothetical protein ASG58_02685 [Rhizobium sp. Leaf383]
MTLINPLAGPLDVTLTERDPQEVRALARLIVFARQNAIDLNLENAVHCLDLALRSVLQENDSTFDGLVFPEASLHRQRSH